TATVARPARRLRLRPKESTVTASATRTRDVEAGLAEIRTDADVATIRQRLDRANRRGRLPEIDWPDEWRFSLILPSRPLLCRLDGRVHDEGDQRRVEFDVAVHRRPFRWLVALNLASVVIGPAVTDHFWPWMRSWFWYPPLALAMTWWIW